MLGIARSHARQLCRAACASPGTVSTIGGRSASLDVGSANSASWGSTFRGFAPLQFVRGAKAAAEAPEKQGKGGSGKAEGGTASLIVKHSIKDVTPADAGRFVVFPESDAAKWLPEGCPALEREFEDSSSRRVLLRESFVRLQKRILGDSPVNAEKATVASPSTVLMGFPGTGKSVLLALTVAWARANGWLALYVPQAHLLTERSQFSHSEAHPGTLDTPDHARALLSSLSQAHAPLLAALPRQQPGAPAGEKLDALVSRGLSPSASPSAAVDAAVAMVEELRLCTKAPVLIAVDELNALSGCSEYHSVTGPKSRKRIPAGQLRVAAAVRDASRPLARGAFLGASTSAGGLSPRLQLEACPDEAKRTVDAFSQAEVEAMLRHYADGGLAQVESEEELLDLATQLRVLSSGSGEAIRRNVIAPALGGRVGRVGRRQFV